MKCALEGSYLGRGSLHMKFDIAYIESWYWESILIVYNITIFYKLSNEAQKMCKILLASGFKMDVKIDDFASRKGKFVTKTLVLQMAESLTNLFSACCWKSFHKE